MDLQLAAPCRCTRRLIFEPGRCFMCGRWLRPVAQPFGNVDGWIQLAAAIERARFDVRAAAIGDGVAEPALYRTWLEAAA